MKGHARLALAATIFLLGNTGAFGATRTWTGASGGDPSWTNPLNWAGNVAPVAGDDLVFNGGPPSNNTFPNTPTFNEISVANHFMTGAPVALDAGLTAEAAQISLGLIKLNNSQGFTAPTSGVGALITSPIDNNGERPTFRGPGDFVLTGAISGTGALTKTGSGTLQLLGPNSYTGTTRITQGRLLVFGSQPASAVIIGEIVQLGSIFTLGGSGTVGPVSFGHIGTIAPGALNNGTGILTINGNLVYPAFANRICSLEVDLNGMTPGTNNGYDQLNVAGAVDLGGGLNELSVTLGSGFTPAPGATFIIINNDGTDAVEDSFAGKSEGSLFTVSGNTFAISYRGGDGNDVILHVPTTRTWDGGGADANWATAANWVGDVVPAVGDDLVFPVGAAQLSNMNDLPAGTLFNSITFQTGGVFLAGNAIALRSGITSTATSGGNVVVLNFASLRLELDQSFTNNGNRGFFIQTPIDTNGHRVTLAGSAPRSVLQALSREISGTGGLTMAASGFCFVDGISPKVNTYTGTTLIASGQLLVRTVQPNSPVQLTGGTLLGQGQVGSVTATGGSIQPHDGVPEALEVAGDLTLSSTAEFAPDLSNNGNLSQLIVTGVVRLNSAALTFADTHNPPSIGESFMVISNDGSDAVEGTFASLPEGSSFVVTTSSGNRTYSISYMGGDGNDVVLTLTSLPTPTPTPTPTGTPTPTPTPTATPSSTPSQPLLGNISTRLRVEAGDNVLIGGFIITGVQDKTVLLRAIGPSLSQFFTGTLENPRLELFQGNTLILSNGDWKDTQRSDIEATTIPPTNDLESAIVATLAANNNAYTAIVRGVSDGTGVGLVEIYDLDSSVDSKLANISTRGFVQTGDNVLIAGTIVIGSGTQKVLVRAIGPSLPLAGKMENPTLELRDQNGGLLQANDNWVDSPDKQAIIDTTIPPTNDLESAIVANLPANNASYTAIVRGVNDTTGIAVVEVYALP